MRKKRIKTTLSSTSLRGDKRTKSSFSLGSLFQLSVLIFGLVLAVFLTDKTQKYIGRAQSSPVPKNVVITILSSNSFSVSWTTDRPATGAIILREEKNLSAKRHERIFFDDKLKNYTPNSLFTEHYVTVSGLTPGKTYHFIILSGEKRYNNQGKDYQVSLPL